jgi:hypothetical protein
MAQTSPQMATIACPNCRRQFTVQVHTIIDADQDPAAKTRLLQGQTNVAICPQCGTGGTLSMPFLYHDSQKELLFVYTPPSNMMDNDRQQRLIGSLINTVMTSLPPEKRKGYLFQPRNFLSIETMLDEIIMADGITREQLESQKRKLGLLERFMGAMSDDVIEAIAKENEKDLDYEFFLLLNNLVENVTAQGNEAEATRLRTLHQKLLLFSGAAQQGEARSAQILTQEQFLKQLLEAEDKEQQKALVAVARPALNYGFFQQLTATIEEAQQAGDSEKASQLLDLRSKILAWIGELDAEVKNIWENKAKLIQEILQSPDWRAALESHWQEIDSVFLTILGSNVQLAQERGNDQAVSALQQLSDLALLVAREHAPPEVQLLNRLFEADYPEGTQRVLEESRDLINAGFLEMMDHVAQDLTAQGRQEDINTLHLIRAQAAEMVGP